jgi:hypothetical protein
MHPDLTREQVRDAVTILSDDVTISQRTAMTSLTEHSNDVTNIAEHGDEVTFSEQAMTSHFQSR